jgi:hypothetical protein
MRKMLFDCQARPYRLGKLCKQFRLLPHLAVAMAVSLLQGLRRPPPRGRDRDRTTPMKADHRMPGRCDRRDCEIRAARSRIGSQIIKEG